MTTQIDGMGDPLNGIDASCNNVVIDKASRRVLHSGLSWVDALLASCSYSEDAVEIRQTASNDMTTSG